MKAKTKKVANKIAVFLFTKVSAKPIYLLLENNSPQTVIKAAPEIKPSYEKVFS